MSAPGTPKASQAAIAAVQEALGAHRNRRLDDGRGSGWECFCGQVFPNWGAHQTHVAVAAADAAAPHNAADAWDEGHLTRWRRGPDDCRCAAYSSSECACGEYGNGELLSLKSNPYRTEAGQ